MNSIKDVETYLKLLVYNDEMNQNQPTVAIQITAAGFFKMPVPSITVGVMYAKQIYAPALGLNPDIHEHEVTKQQYSYELHRYTWETKEQNNG